MDFSQVAAEFQKLKAQYDTGALSEAEFKARLQDLMIQDEQGRWWMIGYETGQWYVHDGKKWVRARPPVAAPPATRPPLRLWLWAGAGIIGVVLLALLIPRIFPGAPSPTAILPTVTPVPPTTTSAPPTATPRPPTATPVPPTITSMPPTATSVPPTATPRPPTATSVLPTITPRPTLSVSPTQISDKDGMAMVYVPAGEFTMGSADGDPDASDAEKPQHKVYLDAFWIDRTEVTKEQYQKCVATDQCVAPGCSGTGQADHPVVCVSWQDAANYCAWAGRRLPTEAEWEKAARGLSTGSGGGRIYPWGNEPPNDKRCNFNNNVGDTTAVGNYPDGVSPYGALDMAGNVWEWTTDWYDEKYYAGSPVQNPTGPASGQARVVRGGSWQNLQRTIRAANRARLAPVGVVTSNVGFRCARGTSP
jgi:formylglycine-generating enzyme required for sulfatase activity